MYNERHSCDIFEASSPLAEAGGGGHVHLKCSVKGNVQLPHPKIPRRKKNFGEKIKNIKDK